MRILVTGGMGLIGHNVVSRLEDLDHEVLIVDNMTNYGIIHQDEIDYLIGERSKKIYSVCQWHNIANHRAIEHIFETFKPEIVIHLASFPRQKVVNNDPAQGARTIIEGLLNLCEASKKHGVSKFVYISSSMVYGDFTDGVKEDAVCNPKGQYGIMKLAGEWLVKDYSRKNDFAHVIIRPSAVYGPLDVNDRVVSKFMLAAMQGTNLIVNGAEEALDFTYVDDTADGIVAATLSDNTHNKTYNITKGHSITLLAAAELAVKLAGKGSINIRDKDLDFPSRGALSIDAARRDFGFDPKVSVEEGFKTYYEWLSNSPFWSSKTV